MKKNEKKFSLTMVPKTLEIISSQNQNKLNKKENLSKKKRKMV